MRNISNLIRSQFPKYMREGDHEKFIAFMQAYYDWLEKQDNPNGIIGTFNDLNDVDKTLDPFLQNFVESFAFALPSRFFETKKDAIKHLKEIHSIKGTPESYKLLFRLLYNEVIDFYFPEEDILRASGQRWNRRSMVAFTSDNFPDIVGKIVRSSNSKFFVTDVRLVSPELKVYFAEFDPDTFEGYFDEVEDTIFWSEQAQEFHGYPATAVTGVRIVTEGSGYSPNFSFNVNVDRNQATVNIDRIGREHYGLVLLNQQGDPILVNDYITQASTGARGFVTRIEGQNFYVAGGEFSLGGVTVEGKNSTATISQITGEIKDVRVLTQSYRGTDGVTTDIPVPPNGGDAASVEVLLGTLFVENEVPSVPYNQPSGRSKIQDGIFYSPYTYVIKSGQSINLWKDMLVRMIHPAGIGIFSQVLILSVYKTGVSGSGGVSGQSQNTVSIFNWQVIDGILEFFKGLDLYFNTYVNVKNNSYSSESELSYSGRDIRYFEQNKFLTPPYSEGIAGTANVYRDQSQLEGYEEPITYDLPDPLLTGGGNDVTDAYHIPGTWNHNNFRIETIENMTIEMFDTPTKYKTNFQPGSFIRFTDVI